MMYQKSDGTSIKIRDMPTPYLSNAIQKARREKNPVLESLEEELRLRETPTWEVRAVNSDVFVESGMTNAEAWAECKSRNETAKSSGLSTRYFVAHESDPI